MPKKYIFIHDLETNEIKVISRIPRRDWLFGNYVDHHFYKMFFSEHKKLVCDCPHNVYFEDWQYCNHRKTFLKLLLDMEQVPEVTVETLELMITYALDLDRTEDE